MNPMIQNEMERLAEVVSDVNEEVELSLEGDTTLEDIERTKAFAAGVLAKYDDFLKRLGPDDRREVQQTIGLKVEQLKGNLTKLKEAPE
jgi:hypothetical protein